MICKPCNILKKGVSLLVVAAVTFSTAATAAAAEPLLSVKVETDKNTYSLGEEITYTATIKQKKGDAIAWDISAWSVFPDEAHIQDVNVIGEIALAYITTWEEQKPELVSNIPAVFENSGGTTDVNVQLQFADGIELPAILTVGLEVSNGASEFNGIEFEDTEYSDYENFADDWEGTFARVPCISGADYNISIMETTMRTRTISDLHASKESDTQIEDQYFICDIEGDITSGITCTVDRYDRNSFFAKIGLGVGESAVITGTATADAVTDNAEITVQTMAQGQPVSGETSFSITEQAPETADEKPKGAVTTITQQVEESPYAESSPKDSEGSNEEDSGESQAKGINSRWFIIAMPAGIVPILVLLAAVVVMGL